MTYTTQQLQAMSEDDLGVAFYDKFCLNFDCYNDIMPLAFERLIAIEPEAQAFTDKVSGNWIATDYNIKHQYIDKSPLRAIACLLLMIED